MRRSLLTGARTVSAIVTEASSLSNAIRSHGFPVLEAGNISYPNGRYALDFEPGGDRTSFVLRHWIEGAPLVSRLLREGKARYVCAVSSPVSSYRRTHVSETESQSIRWDENDLGEPPLFTPMIVSISSCNLLLTKERDGVHEIWDQQEVAIEMGSRLALGHVIQLRSSILQLLSLQLEKELGNGEFKVDPLTEGGFQFRVNLSPDLHQFLQAPREDGIREHVMTHIVSACLSLLKRDFHEDDEDDGGWKSHRNLRAFAEYLESKGLPHWSDEEFHPEWAATKLHPHMLPKESEGGES